MALRGVSALATAQTTADCIADVSGLGVQNGDILIAAYRVASTTTGTAPSGEGWTLKDFITETTAGRFEIWWKRWGDGATDDTTPEFNSAASANKSLVISVWSGRYISGDPFDKIDSAYGTSASLAAQDSNQRALRFKSDGTKMYTVAAGADVVWEYTLSTAWDARTIAFSTSFDTGVGPTAGLSGLDFKPDGTEMYVLTTGQDVKRYTLSTPWLVTSASLTTTQSIITNTPGTLGGIKFSSDGSRMYAIDDTTSAAAVDHYSLSSAWDIATLAYVATLNIEAQETAPKDLDWKQDGTKLFVIGSTGDDINQYTLSSAWDLTTASFDGTFVPPAGETAPFGLAFRSDGVRFYIIGQTLDVVRQFDLSVAWDLDGISASVMSAPCLAGVGPGTDMARLFFSADDNNHGTNSEGTLGYSGTSYHNATLGHAHSMSYIESVSSGDKNGATMVQGSNGPDLWLAFSLSLLAPSPIISGTIAGTTSISGTATGSGALSGTIPCTSTVSGYFTISGTINGTSTVNGAVMAWAVLNSTVNGTSTVEGTLAGSGALNSTINGTSTVTGLGQIDLVGTINGTSTASATLSFDGFMVGTSSNAGAGAGELVANGDLEGSIPGISTVDGTLLGNAVDIEAIVNGTSTVDGTLLASGTLQGSIAGTSTAEVIIEDILGSIAGTSTVTGSLKGFFDMEGLSQGTSPSTGTLTFTMIGIATSVSTASGFLNYNSLANATGVSTGIASASAYLNLRGLASGVSPASARLLTSDIVGRSVRILFSSELHFDSIYNTSNYSVTPVDELYAAPYNVDWVDPIFTTIKSGISGAVIADPTNISAGTSTFLELDGLFTNSHINDFIHINGSSAGTYQILSVPISGARSVVTVSDVMVVGDDNNSIINVQSDSLNSDLRITQIAHEGGDLYTYTFEATHPMITVGTPIVEIQRVLRIARELSLDTVLNPSSFVITGNHAPYQEYELTDVSLVNYRTFTVKTDQGPVLQGIGLDNMVDQFAAVVRTTGTLQWTHTSGISGIYLYGNKRTNNREYSIEVSGLKLKNGTDFEYPFTVETSSGIPKPRLQSAVLNEENELVLTYNEPMQMDVSHLLNTTDYTITGPTTVKVLSASAINPRKVALKLFGLASGSYTVTVSSSTPKDEAGNPLDPTFNDAIFTGDTAIIERSIFTDKGPIAKPELILISGINATINTYEEVTMVGATLTPDMVGKYIRLSGSISNNSTYRILAIVSATRARVVASLRLPEANNGTISWAVIDPRHGEIADDPTDVVVRINGTPITPDAVIGLRGQIVLPTMPDSDDTVDVDYSWCRNPKVEIRRLNSKEFRLNAWNKNLPALEDTKHSYRYNNVLVTPSQVNFDTLLAVREQPQQRDLAYRAIERAYSAVLNDPTRLLLNTPPNKIAYPAANRSLSEALTSYEATQLPENAGWTRKGLGGASIAANTLVVVDFPDNYLFWTTPIDTTYQHVMSVAWRFSIDDVETSDKWTGIAAGYSSEKHAYVVGYLIDAGVRKIGFLKRNASDNLGSLSSWVGGFDNDNVATNAPVVFDWSQRHSYRIFTDVNGDTSLYIAGGIVATLRLEADNTPFLEEVPAPFDKVQGLFFGSFSNIQETVSTWDFFRALVQPINPKQLSRSSFVSYEGNNLPETDSAPWIPIGFHGTSRVSGGSLTLESTSGSDSIFGLITGDYKGYSKIEPLLSKASEVALDAELQLLTHTHGINPDGLFLAIDDGTLLMQLAFLADRSVPKLSYGGRTFPEDFSPYSWDSLGSQTAVLIGRYLKIEDTSTTDGKVYFLEDAIPALDLNRTIGYDNDYFFEARFRVDSYIVDGAGFAGAFVQVFDSSRAFGFMLQVVSGVKYITMHSDGVVLPGPVRWVFNWDNNVFHTIRVRKNSGGDLLSVFADGNLLGTTTYSAIPTTPDNIGILSFGSSTPASSGARSVVTWAYCNAWRVQVDQKRYIGIWKGYDNDSFTGYYMPEKVSGNARVFNESSQGRLIANTDLVAAGVVDGDILVVDAGPNKGVYTITFVFGADTVSVTPEFVSQPTTDLRYRIVKETDWSSLHKYRLYRNSNGDFSVFIDSMDTPVIALDYSSLNLPLSSLGIPFIAANSLPSITFGSFSLEDLESSIWNYVRYGITRSTIEQRAVPTLQVLNQWNTIESPERLYSTVPFEKTGFKSSSTGITPVTTDFLENQVLAGNAYTKLNESTPLVVQTQSYQTRKPFTITEAIADINTPEDLLGNNGVIFGTGKDQYVIQVPDDVLYSRLEIIRNEIGEKGLIQPFSDNLGPISYEIMYTNEACYTYTASALPGPEWHLSSDTPGEVITSVGSGILTYGTSTEGAQTVYTNNTPLLNSASLRSEVTFRLKVEDDATLGIGDTQIRFGISALGFTLGIGFVTSPVGDRWVLVFDLATGTLLGRATVDYLDGEYHTYRIVRAPDTSNVEVFIDV